MIFNSKRNILKILQNFTAFFKHESCGVCTPCRAGNFIIQRKLDKVANGLAYFSDYDDIKQWGGIMEMTSRCGLGKTATRALLLALEKFPDFFSTKVIFSYPSRLRRRSSVYLLSSISSTTSISLSFDNIKTIPLLVALQFLTSIEQNQLV